MRRSEERRKKFDAMKKLVLKNGIDVTYETNGTDVLLRRESTT